MAVPELVEAFVLGGEVVVERALVYPRILCSLAPTGGLEALGREQAGGGGVELFLALAAFGQRWHKIYRPVVLFSADYPARRELSSQTNSRQAGTGI